MLFKWIELGVILEILLGGFQINCNIYITIRADPGICERRISEVGGLGMQFPRSCRVTLLSRSKNDANHKIYITYSHAHMYVANGCNVNYHIRSGNVWWGESLVNLVNHQQFAKRKLSKLVVTINNLLVNLFVR